MRTISFALTLTVTLLTGALGAGCSSEASDDSSTDDAVSGSGTSTLDLVKELPADSTWEQVPASVRAKLAKNAKKTIADYDKAWGEAAIRKQTKTLIESAALSWTAVLPRLA